jgi:hypothetical protein
VPITSAKSKIVLFKPTVLHRVLALHAQFEIYRSNSSSPHQPGRTRKKEIEIDEEQVVAAKYEIEQEKNRRRKTFMQHRKRSMIFSRSIN